MGRLVVSLVLSFYRRHRAGCSKSPEKTWGCPVERPFGWMRNDCPQNMVRGLAWDEKLLGPDWTFG